MTRDIYEPLTPFPAMIGEFYQVIGAVHVPVPPGKPPASVMLLRDVTLPPGSSFGVCDGTIREGAWFGYNGKYDKDHSTALTMFFERVGSEGTV